jgi:hypothetical protein
MQSAHLNRNVTNVFQMPALLERVYYLNKQMTKHGCIYLDENLTPKVKITGSTRHVVLNQIQLFILVTFKSYKSGIHELGDSRHNLFLYCGRYIRIKCEEAQVVLNKSEWSCLMDLASSCLDKQIHKFFRLKEELVEWCNNCFETKSFCTPPSTNAIVFESLYDELMYKKHIFSCSDDT